MRAVFIILMLFSQYGLLLVFLLHFLFFSLLSFSCSQLLYLSLREFLRAIDKHQVLFSLLGLLPKTVDSVTSIIHHKARKLDDLGAGLKSVSTTKKDIILFATPAQILDNY